MGHIVINSKRYEIPSYKELNISQAARIVSLQKSLPSGEVLPLSQCREILTHICGIPRSVVRRTRAGDMNRFARCFISQTYEELTTAGDAKDTPDIPKVKDTPETTGEGSFTLSGETFLLPRTPLNFDGEPIPLGAISAEEFCEATDLYTADALKYAPLIAAILCRPLGEKYDQGKAKQRAETMKELGTVTAFKIFALINNAHEYMKLRFPYCYRHGLANNGAGAAGRISATWNDILLFTAGYAPERIEALSKMNVYDFTALVNSRNKLIKIRRNA